MSDRIERFLEDLQAHDETLYAVVTGVRELVHSVAPGVTEEIKYGGLLFSRQTPVCGVFAYRRHVSVEFTEGAGLVDEHKVLEGSGKHRRHIKLNSPDDIDGRHVEAYLRQAFSR